MHSTSYIPYRSFDFKCSGKLITLQPCYTKALSKETGSQTQQEEQQILENGKERNLPTADGKKVLMTSGFEIEGCPCESMKRKLKTISEPKGTSFVSSPHCELVRKGSDWWIRDLKSARGTFVNGTKLSENGEKKLDDLDIISLGVSHITDPEILNFIECQSEDDGCIVVPHIIYRYKAPILRNIEPKEETTSILVKSELESHLLTSVVGNELIISTILGNLSVPDLKNARLVCKKWGIESTKLLYSCTRVDVPGIDCPHWSYLKENYDCYFKDRKIETVSLDFNYTEKCAPFRLFNSLLQEMRWRMKEQLYLENVDWFLNNFGQGIKSFRLSFIILRNNWSLFLRILEKIPVVEDLQLSFMSNLSPDDMLERVKFPEEEEMSKISSVRSLSIQINDSNPEWSLQLRNYRERFEHLLIGLLKIFPSVEKLYLPELKKGTMEIYINIIKDNTILIPNVKDLAVALDYDLPEDKTVEILKEIQFVNKLRSLELDNLTNCTTTNLNHVMNLLKKTAPYLEILTLGLRESNTFINSLMEEGGGLPAFPQLWCLKIVTINTSLELQELDNYPGVNYETVFPNLKSLKFRGMISNRLSYSHLEHFLRMENDPCRTVVEFELRIEIHVSTIETEPVELRQRIVEKFPNVALPIVKFSVRYNGYYDESDSEFTDGNEYSDSDHSEENSSEEDDDEEDDDHSDWDHDEDEDDYLHHDEDEDDNWDHDAAYEEEDQENDNF